MKTFFKKIENFFKKAFGSAKWEQVASSTLTLVAPLLDTIVGIVAGEPAAELVAAGVAEIQRDLATASVLIADVKSGTSPVQAINLLNSAKTNLSSLLADAHVKDQATLSKVNAVVTTAIAELDAILQAMPHSAAAAA